MVESAGFEWKGFYVPAFTLCKGEMVRLWIQIIPPEGNISGYQLAKEIRSILIRRKSISGLSIYSNISFAEDINESRIKSLIAPLKVAGYLRKKRKLSREVSDSIMQKLQLSGREKMTEVQSKNRRLLSIASLYEAESCVAFDYYGLCPTAEEAVTELIKDKTNQGKSAIAFDNLYYLTQKEPYAFIKRVIVKRSE